MPDLPALPRAARVAALSQLSPFNVLPSSVLEEVASLLNEESFPRGAVVVKEGQEGDRAFIVTMGRAEVLTVGHSGPVTLAMVGPGEMFGEIALLEAGGKRQATVRATTDLHVLTLAAADFNALLQRFPDIGAALVAAADEMLVARFLKLTASPFAALDGAELRRLAAELTRLSVPAGETFIHQGDEGRSCFILQTGRVEILIAVGDSSRCIATLGPGSVIGEAALLTHGLRTASARAIENCIMLELNRDVLQNVLETSQGLGLRLQQTLQMRVRPVRVAGVEAHHRTTQDGLQITVLKDPARGVYFRLSPEGWFIWQQLDGRHSLRDLALAHLKQFKAFAPDAISDLTGSLIRSGLAEDPNIPAAALSQRAPSSGWRRLAEKATSILEWQVAIHGADGALGRMYRAGLWVLYTPVAQVVLALFAIAGVAAFIAASGRVGDGLREIGPSLLLFFIPAQLIAIAVHETGHGLTVKAFGRQVNRAGVGWYWFGPIAFVDTSDMWLTDRWPRVAVSIAGPYADALVGSLASLIAWSANSTLWSAAFWQLALASYLSFVLNLNPLMEFDGYYILSDILDRPNLRKRALSWVGHHLPGALRSPQQLRLHWVEALFGMASIVYVIVMAGVTIVLYRVMIQGWIGGIVPRPVAEGAAWVLATLVICLAGISILGEVRADPSPVGRAI